MPLPPPPDLPDYRNLGVLLRALLLLGLFLLGGLLLDDGGEPLPWRLLRLSSLLVPGALLSLGLLALLGRRLHHGRRRAALAAAAICLLSFAFCGRLLNPLAPMPWGQVLLAGAVGGLMQHYLNLRARAPCPPGLVRGPADRVAGPHPSSFSVQQPQRRHHPDRQTAGQGGNGAGKPGRPVPRPTGRPGATIHAGPRNRIGGHVSGDRGRAAGRAPASELGRASAAGRRAAAADPATASGKRGVFHGIERLADGGEIRIQARRHEQLLELTLSNPVNPEPAADTPGHHMALDNLAERLELYFDAEASLSARLDGDRFITRIRLPYRPAPTQQPG
ncbi:hypothetical protein JOS77_12900 [Chromobacterium haemolyticum]|nr:hypothetical protein JOS77_12900 [Chromobacterium haemolyticum]